MISRTVILVGISLFTTPALADIPAYKDCMGRTLSQFGKSVVISVLGFNLKKMTDAVDARAACRGHLTPEEAAQVYEDGKGFWDLHAPGGDLDPTSRDYSKKV